MKHSRLTVTCLIMFALPLCAAAQTNIQKAFDDFVKKPGVEITPGHNITKDPETLEKTGQYDVCRFSGATRQDVKTIEDAFDMDKDVAYSYNSGRNPNFTLRYGKSNDTFIKPMDGADYVYSLYIDPDNKNYRYAYALTWKEKNGSLTGELIMTYGTTNEYQRKLFFSNGSAVLENLDSATWLSQFSEYINELKNKKNSDQTKYVKRIYLLCKNAKSLSGIEKNLVMTELHNIQYKMSNDSFAKKMLIAAGEAMKE